MSLTVVGDVTIAFKLSLRLPDPTGVVKIKDTFVWFEGTFTTLLCSREWLVFGGRLGIHP